MTTEKVVKSICGVCPGGCGMNVKLVDGKVESIRPIKRIHIALRLRPAVST